MGPLGSGPRCGTDRLGQYKTYGIVQSIRAQRGRARSALYKRVVGNSSTFKRCTLDCTTLNKLSVRVNKLIKTRENIKKQHTFKINTKMPQGFNHGCCAHFKDDRNFWAFFEPLHPSERKMTSLLLILTAFCRPPPFGLRSSLKYRP